MKHAVIGVAHWAFYAFFMFPMFINAETWFYGTKFNGWNAILIHYLLGGAGITIGCFIYKKRRHSLWMGLGVATIVLTDILVNHLTA